MEPKEFFNKPIIGKLTTRKIKDLNLRQNESEDYKKASIDEEKEYEVIDIVIQDGEKIFVTNQWENENLRAVFCIHNNFVKDFKESK